MARSRSVFHIQQSVSAVTVFKRFVLGSSLVWALFGSLLFFLYLNLGVVADEKPFEFGFNLLTFEVFSGFFFIFAVNAICGALIAVPAASAAVSAMPRLDSLERYTLHKPIAKIFVYRSLPWVFYAVAAGVFLILGFSASPQFVRSNFSSPAITNLALRINRVVYSSKIDRRDLREVRIKNHAVVIQVPASVLTREGSLPRVEKFFGRPVPFLIDVQSYAAQVVHVLEGDGYSTSNAISPFYETSFTSAASIRSAAEKFVKDTQFKNVTLLPSPENKFLVSKITDEVSPIKLDGFIWKRIVLSQPHLFFLYRINLLRILGEDYKWKFLLPEDELQLEELLSVIAQQKKQALNFVQLSELDTLDSGIRHPLSGLKWPDLNKNEEKKLYGHLDKLLEGFLKTLADAGIRNVVIIPYPDRIHTAMYSKAFVNERVAASENVSILSRNIYNGLNGASLVLNNSCVPTILNGQNSEKLRNLFTKRWSYLEIENENYLSFSSYLNLQNMVGREFVGICFADRTYVLKWNRRIDDKNSFRYWLFNKPVSVDASKKREKEVQSSLDTAVATLSVYTIEKNGDPLLLERAEMDQLLEQLGKEEVLRVMEASTSFLLN